MRDVPVPPVPGWVRPLGTIGFIVCLIVAVAAVAAIPAAAATPTLSVTPSTGLTDGQTVTVTGAGFSPRASIGVAECRAAPTGPADCDLSSSTTLSADGTGAFSTALAVSRMIQVGASTIDCANPGACVLAGANLANLGEAALAPIQFDASIPALHVSLSVDPGPFTVAQDGSVLVTGALNCNRPTSVNLFVSLQQPQNGAGGSSPIASLPCPTSPAAWSETVRSLLAGFQTGPANLHVQAIGPTRSSTTHVDLSVTLHGAASPTVPRYYLALGDSVPVFPDPTTSYAADLTAFYRPQIPGLNLVNIACSSETTNTLLHGGICSYPAGAQINAAEAFLAQHAGQIALITIDIGGNDILPCAPLSTPPACFTQALQTMDTNLTQILGRLRQAAGTSVPIAAMNYYDPYLIYWLDGPAGQTRATTSLNGLSVLNAHLTTDYANFGIPTADVAGAYSVNDFTDLISSPWGTIPKNVALACSWLDVACHAGGPQGFGDDPNQPGSQVIAAAFEQVINLTPTPITVTPRFTG
jgi:lysophospholipase L1-like esterase